MSGFRCIATTSRGYGCINKAQPGQLMCPAHDPSRQCGAPTRAGGQCRRMKMQGHPRCSKHLPKDA
jgi:hypothetical protein